MTDTLLPSDERLDALGEMGVPRMLAHRAATGLRAHEAKYGSCAVVRDLIDEVDVAGLRGRGGWIPDFR